MKTAKFYEVKASKYEHRLVEIYMYDEVCMTLLREHVPGLIELLNEAIGKPPFDFEEYTNKRNALIEQERYEEVIKLDKDSKKWLKKMSKTTKIK